MPISLVYPVVRDERNRCYDAEEDAEASVDRDEIDQQNKSVAQRYVRDCPSQAVKDNQEAWKRAVREISGDEESFILQRAEKNQGNANVEEGDRAEESCLEPKRTNGAENHDHPDQERF